MWIYNLLFWQGQCGFYDDTNLTAVILLVVFCRGKGIITILIHKLTKCCHVFGSTGLIFYLIMR